MGKTTKYTDRKFLGLVSKNASKESIRFHQKHERAYLKGYEYFRFGFEKQFQDAEDGTQKLVTVRDSNGNPIPKWHKVLQQVDVNEEKRLSIINKTNN